MPERSKIIDNSLRLVTGLALLTAIDLPNQASAQETPEQIYSTRLVSKINIQRENLGLPTFGVSPEGRKVEAKVQQYITDLSRTWDKTGGVCFPGGVYEDFPSSAFDYAKEAGEIGENKGEVIACKQQEGYADPWEDPETVANAWLLSPQSYSVLYQRTDANAIVCAITSGESNKAVACLTIFDPRVNP